MVRSKYIADQAVETARLCVLKASEAEREAMKKKQEAEQALVNTGFAVQAGIDTARAGYKAAHAGQIATVMGQQAAVWEDPNLPPQDTIRQLEYVTRLIDSVMDKANEVTYKALLLAFAHEENGSLIDQAKKWAGHQTFVRRQVNITTRNLANILANRTTKEKEKLSVINSEAEHIYKFIDDKGFDASLNGLPKAPAQNKSEVLSQRLLMGSQQDELVVSVGELVVSVDELVVSIDELRDLIPDMVKLALQQVAMANHICALTAWRISRVRLKKGIQGQIDTTHSQLLCEQEVLYIGEIVNSAASAAEEAIKHIENMIGGIAYIVIALNSQEKIKNVVKTDIVADKIEQIDSMYLTIQKLLTKGCSKWAEKHAPSANNDNNGFNSTSTDDQCQFQNLDELMVQVSQAIDIATSQANEALHKTLILVGQEEQGQDNRKQGDQATWKIAEDLMDQTSTLASRVAVLAYQERIAIWGEYSENEKDDPQILGAVVRQASDIANDAAQAAERAFQAANRANQVVASLTQKLDEPYQIGRIATQAYTWSRLPIQKKISIRNSWGTIGSSLEQTKQVCLQADAACKDARNVYEKIEQERQDAEQACKRGIVAAQSVSWWPIWPWSKVWSVFAWLGWLKQWFEPSKAFKQSAEAAKQVSEAVDHVGHAAVLAGQAVAQSGQAVTQASQATTMVGQIATQRPDSIFVRLSKKPSEREDVTETLSSIDYTAQQVADSVSRAAQTVAQAGQAADRVAEAAQTTEKVANIAQAVQQIEWLKKSRQKWIFWLGVLLSLASISILLLMLFPSVLIPIIELPTFLAWSAFPSPTPFPIINGIIVGIIIVAIVDSTLLFTCFVENVRKITRMPHRVLTLICCVLLLLIAGFTLFDVLTFQTFHYPPNGTFDSSIVVIKNITVISIALLIILPPLLTVIVYYQHCTLNNLHPYDVPTSTLES